MKNAGDFFRRRIIAIPILIVITTTLLYFIIQSILSLTTVSISSGMILGIALTISFLLACVANLSKKRQYRGIEHGSSKWGTSKEAKQFRSKIFAANILLSAGIRLNTNMYETKINNHVFITGGSGSGKSRFYVIPNLMQMNASYMITDPSGEILRNTGKMLKEDGYRIKVFDAKNLNRGMKFNPFVYFKEIKDIRRYVDMLMANTTGDTTHPQSGEDFWVKSERLWMMAHISYLFETCPPYEQTMPMLVRLLDESRASEEDEQLVSPIDILFEQLENENPQSYAVRQYKKYKQAAGRTAKSILISVGVRLSDWDIPEISEMFSEDEMELDTYGDQKTALFILLDDADTTYGYLASLLLDCAFTALKRRAEESPGYHLKIPVRVILDEFPNIGRFPKIKTLIAVLRKYFISLEIIVQNVMQMKSLYKDDWVTIEGNCDTTLFLGGKGEDTTKYVSDSLLGKTTIETVNHGGTGGGGFGYSSYNDQTQSTGRNLLDENEVARLSVNECIVSIKGVPFKDKKYNPKNHPNYQKTGLYSEKNEYHLGLNGREEKENQFYYLSEIDLQEVS